MRSSISTCEELKSCLYRSINFINPSILSFYYIFFQILKYSSTVSNFSVSMNNNNIYLIYLLSYIFCILFITDNTFSYASLAKYLLFNGRIISLKMLNYSLLYMHEIALFAIIISVSLVKVKISGYFSKREQLK